MRQATRAPLERPPSTSGSPASASARSRSTTSSRAASSCGRGRGRAPAGDPVGLLDEDDSAALLGGRGRCGLQIRGIDAAAGAVPEDHGGAGVGGHLEMARAAPWRVCTWISGIGGSLG